MVSPDQHRQHETGNFTIISTPFQSNVINLVKIIKLGLCGQAKGKRDHQETRRAT